MGKSEAKSKAGKAPPKFSKELLDELLAGGHSPEDILGPGGLLKQLTAALVNRVMEAEVSEHLGYERGEAPPAEQPNRRTIPCPEPEEEGAGGWLPRGATTKSLFEVTRGHPECG